MQAAEDTCRQTHAAVTSLSVLQRADQRSAAVQPGCGSEHTSLTVLEIEISRAAGRSNAQQRPYRPPFPELGSRVRPQHVQQLVREGAGSERARGTLGRRQASHLLLQDDVALVPADAGMCDPLPALLHPSPPRGTRPDFATKRGPPFVTRAGGRESNSKAGFRHETGSPVGNAGGRPREQVEDRISPRNGVPRL